MPYPSIYVDDYENRTGEPEILHGIWKLNPRAKIFKSQVSGPLYLNVDTQIGPEVTLGKYVGMNAQCYVGRATVGSFIAFGARTMINPFNHPTNWLSSHEFQYRDDSFGWVQEYRDIQRLSRSADMFKPTTVGSDVWMGHGAMVMPGVSVGHGAIIAAGTVVTKDVPPYAIVAGVPGTVKKLRFSEAVVERLLRVRWWDMDLPDLSGLDFRNVESCLDRLEDMRASLGE